MNETGLCTIEQFPSACTWKSAYCVMAHLSYTKLPSTIPNMVLVYYSGLWYNAINSHYHQKLKLLHKVQCKNYLRSRSALSGFANFIYGIGSVLLDVWLVCYFLR